MANLSMMRIDNLTKTTNPNQETYQTTINKFSNLQMNKMAKLAGYQLILQILLQCTIQIDSKKCICMNKI